MNDRFQIPIDAHAFGQKRESLEYRVKFTHKGTLSETCLVARTAQGHPLETENPNSLASAPAQEPLLSARRRSV